MWSNNDWSDIGVFMTFHEARTFTLRERTCQGPIEGSLYTYRRDAMTPFFVSKARRAAYNNLQYATRIERWFERTFCKYFHRGRYLTCPRCEKRCIQKWQHDHEYCCMANTLTQLAE